MLNAKIVQRVREAKRASLQIAVGYRSVWIDEGQLARQSACHICVDKIDCGVIGPAPRYFFQHRQPLRPQTIF